MKLKLKAILILMFLFTGSQAFAYTSDYKPMFLLKQSKKSLVDLKNNLEKEFSQLQFIVTKKKKVSSFVKTGEASKERAPASPKKSLPL